MISKLKHKMQFLKSNVSERFLLFLRVYFFSLVSAKDFGKPFKVPDTAYIKSMIPDARDPGNYGRLADLEIEIKSLLPTHVLSVKLSTDFGAQRKLSSQFSLPQSHDAEMEMTEEFVGRKNKISHILGKC